MEENKIICSCCGSEIDDDDYTEFDGQILCNACFDDETTICDFCGDRVWHDDANYDNHITVCNHCYERYYTRCENCNRIIYEDDVYELDGYPYCAGCYSNECLNNKPIHDYSFKPSPVFYGDCNNNTRFFGVELEIDIAGKEDDYAEEILEIANADKEHIYIKADGSLDDGFEIVTHPMTLEYHKKFCWEDIMRHAVSIGYRSHQTSTCGLHIHVNRNSFSDDYDEQEEIISRILYFVEHHWNEMLKFSRRSETAMNRWAARYGYEHTPKAVMDKAKKYGNGRYSAINLHNCNTIEFRLFRGTLKYNTLMASIELVKEICDVACNYNDEQIAALSWSEFVSDITEPHLIQYLKERRLYINEIIENVEDI